MAYSGCGAPAHACADISGLAREVSLKRLYQLVVSVMFALCVWRCAACDDLRVFALGHFFRT